MMLRDTVFPLRTLVCLLLLAASAACGDGSGPVTDEGQDQAGEPDEDVVASVPDVDIYLVRLGGEDLSPGPAVAVTDRPGYDNQPAFLSDSGALLYASVREDGQSDIWRYQLGDGSHTRITRTEESEFSPTPLHRGDTFTTVRVETDGAQRLWLYDGGGEPVEPIRPELTDVGYHAWLDRRMVALFRVQEPLRLEVVDIATGEARHVADGIGRGLARMADGRLSFVDTDGEDWSLRAWDPSSGEIETLTGLPQGSEDYAWLPERPGLLMAEGTRLRHWSAAGGWRTLADLEHQVDGVVTRLAVSPDGMWLALVATQPEEEEG